VRTASEASDSRAEFQTAHLKEVAVYPDEPLDLARRSMTRAYATAQGDEQIDGSSLWGSVKPFKGFTISSSLTV
jgi:hypothetical protein